MPIDLGTLAAFSLGMLAVFLAPGVDIAHMASKGMRHGVRGGVVAGLGIAIGVAVQAVAAALAGTLLFKASPVIFTVVKWAGVAYLIWLEINVLKQHDETTSVSGEREWSVLRTLAKGAAINLLNPKIALFFVAFLQFVSPTQGSMTFQLALLGGILAAASVVWCSLVGATFGGLGNRFGRSPTVQRWQRRVTGTAFVGFATALGFSDLKR
ncbi:LysE family translocator [Salipiger mucosus]|uniref:LysE family translocator n=1 Tax=Salipiger mucosus TaxID=263378 RepID=UPI00036A3ADD|nr:LysE family translocator [Salipiger mucosus]